LKGERAMKVINLTPHNVNVWFGEDHTMSFPRSDNPARIAVTAEPIISIPTQLGDIPVVRNVYGDIHNLPAPEDGVVYLVSIVVLTQCAGRCDVFAPDTSPDGVIRDSEGKIVAVKRFVAAD